MLLALKQAWLGRGRSFPNPSVGAVLVHGEHIIAKSYHEGAGKPHAEQNVLALLPPSLSSVTLYVTLEPCNHWGRTPPCVDAIIKAGIRRVVYGYTDPHPLVANNNTPEILRTQGIEVLHYPLEEIDMFYRSYHYWVRTGLPWVTVKMAQSLDGKIAGEGGERIQLSNAACEVFTQKNREHTDVILTTAATVKKDNPRFTARISAEEKGKHIAIVDSDLSITQEAALFAKALHTYLYCHQSSSPPQNTSALTYTKVRAFANGLHLPSILRSLGDLGFHDVWVEAGGRLFSSLHKECLVQTTYLYIVPRLLGEKAIKAYHDITLLERNTDITWTSAEDNLIACFQWENDTCLQE